jgi:crotonobetainyl-CoA:carnitine CoA-transferase CaiB-like acyl-CoA transferase
MLCGDGVSGMTLAGGIGAALARRALTGQTSIVDGRQHLRQNRPAYAT